MYVWNHNNEQVKNILTTLYLLSSSYILFVAFPSYQVCKNSNIQYLQNNRLKTYEVESIQFISMCVHTYLEEVSAKTLVTIPYSAHKGTIYKCTMVIIGEQMNLNCT